MDDQQLQNNNIPAPLPPVKEKSKVWKWVKRTVLFLVTLVILFVIVVRLTPSILSVLDPYDDPLIDDSDVRLTKISVPEAENGFFDFNSIGDKDIFRPSENEYKSKLSFSLDYTNFINPVTWDQNLVDQVLGKNQQALEILGSATAKKYFQIPEYQDPSNIYPNKKIYPMNHWRELSRLQAVKSISLARAGKIDEALGEAVKLNEIGHKIMSGHNSLVGGLVGIAIHRLGSQTILEILTYGSPTKKVSTEIILRLNRAGENKEGYKNAFKFDHTLTINSIHNTLDKELGYALNSMVESGEASTAAPKLLKYKYYYKPNQTANLYTNLNRLHVTTAGELCDLPGADELILENKQKITGWKMLFRENLIGRLMFGVTGLSLKTAVVKGCENDLISNITIIELALLQYKEDKGDLPSNLNQLIPSYLSSIPLDPFDHQPIRYSASKKTLYSIGVNKKDLGGSEGEDWAKMDNPTFKIKF